jgi:hypothetical protein
MRWITREKVKVDRVACPWLISRFIDNSAQFVFLPADTNWAAITDGVVYDVPNCELGHHGEDVSFQSILKKYQLEDDPALQLLGEVVQAADSNPSEPHPAGEGLRWIAHSFSALGMTDREILQREFIVYDAPLCGMQAEGVGSREMNSTMFSSACATFKSFEHRWSADVSWQERSAAITFSPGLMIL